MTCDICSARILVKNIYTNIHTNTTVTKCTWKVVTLTWTIKQVNMNAFQPKV